MTLKEYQEKLKGQTLNKNKYLTNFLIKTLISAILVFLILIIVNFSSSFKSIIKENVFKSNFNFAKINNIYNKYVTSIFKKEAIPVFEEESKDTYEEYKDGVKVKNDAKTISLLSSGIVIYIGEKEDYGNTIIIQQSDGIDAWYGNIEKVNVKLYDYIEKGTLLGNKKDGFHYLLFQKEGKFLDYKSVLQ